MNLTWVIFQIFITLIVRALFLTFANIYSTTKISFLNWKFESKIFISESRNSKPKALRE